MLRLGLTIPCSWIKVGVDVRPHSNMFLDKGGC